MAGKKKPGALQGFAARWIGDKNQTHTRSKQGSQIRGSIPAFSLYNFPDIRDRVIPLTLAGAKDVGPKYLSFEGVEINKGLYMRFLSFRDPGWTVLETSSYVKRRPT